MRRWGEPDRKPDIAALEGSRELSHKSHENGWAAGSSCAVREAGNVPVSARCFEGAYLDLKGWHEAPHGGPTRTHRNPVVDPREVVTDDRLAFRIRHRLTAVVTYDRLILDLDPFTKNPVRHLGGIPRILIDRCSKPPPPRAVLTQLRIGFMTIPKRAAWKS